MDITKEQFDETKSKAEAGNPLYMTDLGMFYVHGLGTSIDTSKGLYWIKKAIEGNDPMAYHNLGTFYKEGAIVEKDYKKALKYLRKAAELGSGRSCNDIGAMYEQGEGVNKDYTVAANYYQKAIDIDKYPIAYRNLAYLYNKGLGVERNELKSFELYLDGAEAGDEESEKTARDGLYYFYCKGICYYYGYNNYPKNEDLGNQYIGQTARLQFPLALNFKAKQYLEKNNKMMAETMLRMGGNQIRPKDYVENVSRAICYYSTEDEEETYHGATRNEPDEVCCYAILYILGYYDCKSPSDIENLKYAINKMRQVAEAGFYYAYFWVGYCYERGIGLEKSIEKAISAYRKVTENFPRDTIWNFDNNGTIIFAAACRLAKLCLTLGLEGSAEYALIQSKAIDYYDEAAVIMVQIKESMTDIERLKMAANRGNAEANFIMAEKFSESGSEEQKEYYIQAILQGKTEAVPKVVGFYEAPILGSRSLHFDNLYILFFAILFILIISLVLAIKI